MGILNDNQLMGASGAGGDYEIEQSLRFDDGRGTYLSRTPSVAGNRKTWTWSGWVKRGNLSTGQKVFAAGTSDTNGTSFQVLGNTGLEDVLQFYTIIGGTDYGWNSTLKLRDTSAWYHLVIIYDASNATGSDRMRAYVNSERITAFVTDYGELPLNTDSFMNATNVHTFGKHQSNASTYLDGYLAEVNFIDGQALTADSFGETGTYGEWKPIAYDGGYGTNGFYLPFKQDYAVEGFSTVVYEGNGATQYIGGTGFQPDFTWIKERSSTSSHALYDSIRGALKQLESNTTDAESTASSMLTSFDTDGFSVGSSGAINQSGQTYVAWNWDMGGTTASNTDGTITTSVRANTTYGQSIVSYTGNATNTTRLGHGLDSTPEIVIVKSRTTAAPWKVGGSVIQAVYGDGSNNSAFLSLNTTAAADQHTTGFQGNTATTIGVGADSDTNSNGATYIAYAFHSVTGYSKFGSYSGNGSTTGPVVTLGFSPAFLIIRRSNAVENWRMYDNTRSPTNPVNKILQPNEADAEATGTNNTLNFTSTGFQLTATNGGTNASGGTYIYMAFADTREYAYWLDQSGNNNDWTSEGGLTESDVMVDSPTNNFATWNPTSSFTGYATATLSEGNLKAVLGDNAESKSSLEVSSGKWYWEVLMYSLTDNKAAIGIHNTDNISYSGGASMPNTANVGTVWFGHTGIQGYAPDSSYGTFTTGDIIGAKLDMDNKTIQYTKNGVAQGTVNFSSAGFDNVIACGLGGSNTQTTIANFGQDSSFAGNKTAQGNQDGNDIGDFYYAPPTGFLSLCSANLPSVDVIPSEHFNTVLYTGNGADNHAISGVGFQPDFVWMKSRSASRSHALVDTVRGRGSILFSDSTSAQQVPSAANNDLVSFDTDGFTVGTPERAGSTNTNNDTIVAWNWKAGGSASSNSNGSITSSVSANPSAGFSIVSYTGTGSNATIGHGLASVPTLLIVKKRIQNGSDGARSWAVYSDASVLGNAKSLYLNATNNAFAAPTFWNSTTPTSSVFSIGSGTGSQETNINGDAYIAYCFHNVDGYLKTGSYIGNGNADGPFVHLGSKAKFIMIKEAVTGSGNGEWQIFDTARSPINVVDDLIAASTSGAESVNNGYQMLDILSNGFKLRSPTLASQINMATTYIYLAFAESPFKHTNAR